jgi:excisionase family DNA binding protein
MSERETLSIPEVAVRLGIDRNSAYEAAKRGEIPVIRMGRRLLVSRVWLDRLLATGTELPTVDGRHE